MNIQYQEAKMSDIINYFSKDYYGNPDILDWFYDSNKGIVVFKLATKETEKSPFIKGTIYDEDDDINENYEAAKADIGTKNEEESL